MSRVFVAEERELRRRVVIKVLPPDLAAGINTDRFRREVQLAASLQGDLLVNSGWAAVRDDPRFQQLANRSLPADSQ
jgi:hypothetical protein